MGILWLRLFFIKSTTFSWILGILGDRGIDIFPDSAHFNTSPIVAFPVDVSSSDSPCADLTDLFADFFVDVSTRGRSSVSVLTIPLQFGFLWGNSELI